MSQTVPTGTWSRQVRASTARTPNRSATCASSPTLTASTWANRYDAGHQGRGERGDMIEMHSRRRFLTIAFGAAAASAIAAACAPPQPTFTPLPPTPAPTKPAAAPTTAPAAAATAAPAAGGAAAPTTAPAAGATPAPAGAAPAAGGAATKLIFWTHNYQPLITFTQKKIEEYKKEAPN